MGLEDKHLNVLQNIEFAISAVDRERDDMRDVHAIKALEALEGHIRSYAAGKIPEPHEGLGEIEREAVDRVLGILHLRDVIAGEERPSRRGFSRVFREPTQEEIYLACIRKIHKSAKRWNKRNGERGYLDFIIGYVL